MSSCFLPPVSAYHFVCLSVFFLCLFVVGLWACRIVSRSFCLYTCPSIFHQSICTSNCPQSVHLSVHPSLSVSVGHYVTTGQQVNMFPSFVSASLSSSVRLSVCLLACLRASFMQFLILYLCEQGIAPSKQVKLSNFDLHTQTLDYKLLVNFDAYVIKVSKYKLFKTIIIPGSLSPLLALSPSLVLRVM